MAVQANDAAFSAGRASSAQGANFRLNKRVGAASSVFILPVLRDVSESPLDRPEYFYG